MTWPKIPALIMTDTVDVYSGTTGRDSAGGPDISYALSPTIAGIRCSVQFDSIEEIIDEQNRVTQRNLYNVLFQENPGVKARDMFIWVDSGGVVHRLFARSSVELTGEGETWEVPVVERI